MAGGELSRAGATMVVHERDAGAAARARVGGSRSPSGREQHMHRSGLHAARRRRRLNGRSSQATDVQRIGRRWRAGVGWQCGQLVGVRLTGAGAAAEQSGAATSGFFFRALVCAWRIERSQAGASGAAHPCSVSQAVLGRLARPSCRDDAGSDHVVTSAQAPRTARQEVARARKGSRANGVAVLLGAAPVRENCALTFYITPGAAQPSHDPMKAQSCPRASART